jgi:uncharacterized phage infection (PIP) family protein YhgE
LLLDSPAVEAGDDTLLGPPHNLQTDQRGVVRKFGGHIDIGAFELNDPRVNLQELIDELTQQNALLLNEIESLRKQLGEFKDQNTDLTNQIKTLQDLVNSLRAETQSLQSSVDTLTQQNQSLSQQNQMLTRQNNDLQKQLQAANRAYADLKTQLAKMQAQNAEMENAIKNFVGLIELDLRILFRNPKFTIPGATPVKKLKTIQAVLLFLNRGHKEGLYKDLGGRP